MRVRLHRTASHALVRGRSITVGYHRLYSHRAFRATLPVRALVAVLGAGAFQGSIKVRIELVASPGIVPNDVSFRSGGM